MLFKDDRARSLPGLPAGELQQILGEVLRRAVTPAPHGLPIVQGYLHLDQSHNSPPEAPLTTAHRGTVTVHGAAHTGSGNGSAHGGPAQSSR